MWESGEISQKKTPKDLFVCAKRLRNIFLSSDGTAKTKCKTPMPMDGCEKTKTKLPRDFDVSVERFDKWPMPLDDPSKALAISPMHKSQPPRPKKNPPMDKLGCAKCIEEMVREEIRLVEAISILKMRLVGSSSDVFMAPVGFKWQDSRSKRQEVRRWKFNGTNGKTRLRWGGSIRGP